MLEPEVVFQDENVLVINKPAGLIVHSDGRTEEPSVAEWVAKTFPAMVGVGEAWTSPQGVVIQRPGIVHRLDRTTSGIMILAKHDEAYTFLKTQFQDRTTTKEYRAFVYGHMKEKEGLIEREIVRLRSTPPRWGVKRVGEDKKHRHAITGWHLLGKGVDSTSQERFSYVALFPKTGRTHQLRVHMKAIEHPILCDHLYASSKPCILGFDRPALHAFRLSVTLMSGTTETWEAPLPQEFAQVLSFLESQS